jgi:hypothetical protein
LTRFSEVDPGKPTPAQIRLAERRKFLAKRQEERDYAKLMSSVRQVLVTLCVCASVHGAFPASIPRCCVSLVQRRSGVLRCAALPLPSPHLPPSPPPPMFTCTCLQDEIREKERQNFSLFSQQASLGVNLIVSLLTAVACGYYLGRILFGADSDKVAHSAAGVGGRSGCVTPTAAGCTTLWALHALGGCCMRVWQLFGVVRWQPWLQSETPSAPPCPVHPFPLVADSPGSWHSFSESVC